MRSPTTGPRTCRGRKAFRWRVATTLHLRLSRRLHRFRSQRRDSIFRRRLRRSTAPTAPPSIFRHRPCWMGMRHPRFRPDGRFMMSSGSLRPRANRFSSKPRRRSMWFVMGTTSPESLSESTVMQVPRAPFGRPTGIDSPIHSCFPSACRCSCPRQDVDSAVGIGSAGRGFQPGNRANLRRSGQRPFDHDCCGGCTSGSRPVGSRQRSAGVSVAAGTDFRVISRDASGRFLPIWGRSGCATSQARQRAGGRGRLT